MRNFALTALLLVVVLDGTACAPIPQNQQLGDHGTRILTRAEMESTGFAGALDAIEALRPGELPPIAPSQLATLQRVPAVFIDRSSRDIGLAALAEVPVTTVCRIRFLSGADALLRYGLKRAIVVQTVNGGDCN